MCPKTFRRTFNGPHLSSFLLSFLGTPRKIVPFSLTNDFFKIFLVPSSGITLPNCAIVSSASLVTPQCPFHLPSTQTAIFPIKLTPREIVVPSPEVTEMTVLPPPSKKYRFLIIRFSPAQLGKSSCPPYPRYICLLLTPPFLFSLHPSCNQILPPPDDPFPGGG